MLNALAEVERTSRQLQATQDTLQYLDEAVAQAVIVREQSETRFTEGISSLDPCFGRRTSPRPAAKTAGHHPHQRLETTLRAGSLHGGSAGFRPFDSE